ncbi:YlbF family regulator [Phycisphaera mikurensis]|uniref:YlbF family regulator n=1 Tax=Phycisphaera mikurensis (strain NBRC 102666 / KCTC 22515 / FYK2301M01) TaxID=1142394 RepID=I0IE97_PHYMF|nr:YlbF family regulator [Phycisphaera mikurensis]MBB6441388.1 cell fate (sporulation/competence/biofilm development) regulator YlbF (YheA/YmcA/DUF963 family) [Phycisphaera mikurensis]BAM03585.1 hypothetical protein PSMK_14260 [Phycisphaera mikurensis NBRC 102666]
MSDKQAILDAATEVGKLLKGSDAVERLNAAAKAFRDDVTAQRTVVDFNRFLQTLAQKESQGQPIEVEDKRKLTELQDKVASDPQLRNMQKAQMDYVDLLRAVDQAIQAQTGVDDATAGAGGGGNPFGG